MAGSGIRKRFARVAPVTVAGALLSSAILAASFTGTLSAFTASITNSTNTAASGSIVMQETQTAGGTNTSSTNPVCLSTSGTSNSFTCDTINKFGKGTNMYPGGPASTATVEIKNTGTSAVSSFTLAPGTCTVTSSNGGSATQDQVCQAFQLAIYINGSNSAYWSGSLKSFATKDLSSYIPTAGGAATTVSFSVTLPATATIDSANTAIGNAYQGKTVSLPLTWTFTGAS